MSLQNLIDTLLNIWGFAFIGILIWLYFKKEPDGSNAKEQNHNQYNDTLDRYVER